MLKGLTAKHQASYTEFYNSTKANEHLSARESLLVGLAAAMAVNCLPCQRFYLLECKKAGVTRGDISEVLAKVMAVSAGQKRLQFQEVLERHDIDLDAFPSR
jgi:alkylhydroperoxidase/carboxymuconolactone decarboxylase family protein YurZ